MFNSEYIVTLRKGVDPENFKDMMTSSGGPAHIPSRQVVVVNERPSSLRSTEYAITSEEAAELRKHPDVLAVEADRYHDMKRSFARQYTNFQRSMSSMNPYSVNWGLKRTAMDVYADPRTISNDYGYVLDGTGVDVVIQDDGVWAEHPEFADENGNSRVIEHNWFAEAGLSGSMPEAHYGGTDLNYHGTHVAGIVAGKYHGYAKGARIYSIRFDSAGGLATNEEFDLVRLWHERKPIDPATGYKRPTIVNASWGYSWYLPNYVSSSSYQESDDEITELGYRGQVETSFSLINSEGYLRTKQFAPFGKRVGLSLAYVDAAVEDMIDAGVIFVTAAGNSQWKNDVPGGIDYDNYIKSNNGWPSSFEAIVPQGDPIYYCRKGSPTAPNAINVGSIDSVADHRSSFSEKGPRVDVHAPGSDVVSAGSPAAPSTFSVVEFFTNTKYVSKYRDTEYLNLRIGGTSMASPQVTGVLALFLQLNPWATQDDCLRFIRHHASKPGINDTGEDDATAEKSLNGAPNRYLFNPFAVGESYMNKPIGQPTFRFEVDDQFLDEENEETATITLTTTGIPNNTVLTYTLTGVDELDFAEGTTGNFVIVNNTATVTLTASADFRSDREKMARLKLDDYPAACFIQVNDSSNLNFGLTITDDADQRPGIRTVYANKTWNITVTGHNIQPGESYTYRWFFNGPFGNTLMIPYAGAPTSTISQFTLTHDNPSIELEYSIGPFGSDNPLNGCTWYLAQEGISEFTSNGYGIVAQIGFAFQKVARPDWTVEFLSDHTDENGHFLEGYPFKLRMVADDPQYAPPGTRVYYSVYGTASPYNDVSGFNSRGTLTVTRSDGILEVNGLVVRDGIPDGGEVFRLALGYSSYINGETLIGIAEFTIADSP